MRRRIFITALVLMLIISSMESVFADTSRATFTNEKNNAPHLYVSKTVTTASSSYEVPDADFHFTLKLDGSLASNVEYRVYDSDGIELYNFLFGIKVPWKTSRSGDFTLKAGQTAEFEYAGAGKSYEVTESNLASGFTQVSPAAGLPATGTVLPDGTTVEFINSYAPVEEKEYTTLEVSKGIIFPSGYQAPSAPAFKFILELDGKVYANENYSVIDLTTGKKVGEGTTLADGSFELTKNQIARFENVRTNIDYKVTEQNTEGWNAVGKTNREGATIAPLTSINYTNSNVSFGVSKTLSDYSGSDTEFEFTLTDSLRVATPDISYFLYNWDGTRADNDKHKTDANGIFKLKANQTAIFTGIEKGTVYNVSEKADPNFSQAVPASNEGYKDKVVTDNFEMLPFVNAKRDISNALTVTKTVSAGTSGEMPVANDIFTFKLTKKTGTGYEAVANAVYSVATGTVTSTFKTDADGKFTLKRNETAVFERLAGGETYKVEEIDLNTDYTCKEPTKEGKLDGNLNFIIDNIFKMKAIDLKIKKVNSTDSPLMNARFDLYTDEQMNNKINDNPLITDSDGEISLSGIASGLYYLKETQSPSGYRLLANPIKIEMVREGADLKVYIDGEENSDIVTINKSPSTDDVTIAITNYRNFELPITGGAGIVLPILIAVIGIAGISFLMIRKKRNVKPSISR